MLVALNVVHRYLAPALAGICVAAAAASDGGLGTTVAVLFASASVLVSSPYGVRFLSRVVKADV